MPLIVFEFEREQNDIFSHGVLARFIQLLCHAFATVFEPEKRSSGDANALGEGPLPQGIGESIGESYLRGGCRKRILQFG